MLPRLHAELRPARAVETNRSGRVVAAGHPAYVRVLFSPVTPLVTSSPRRLEALAADLLDLAGQLRRTQTGPTTPDPAMPSLFDINEGANQ